MTLSLLFYCFVQIELITHGRNEKARQPQPSTAKLPCGSGGVMAGVSRVLVQSRGPAERETLLLSSCLTLDVQMIGTCDALEAPENGHRQGDRDELRALS